MATNNVINNAFADNFTAPNKVSKNLMPAGNFTTNPWQAGTSFTASSPSLRYADRFRYTRSGVITAVFDIIKDSDSPTVAESGILSTSCAKFSCTTSQTTIAASDAIFSTYGIEGYDFSTIAQRPFTLSFWVKSNVTGVYCVSFRNSANDISYVSEYTINVANTWEKKIITVSASPSAGTWNYTNSLGLSINFIMSCGTTFHTASPNTWVSSNVLATANQVNFASSNTNTFQFALIQLESGTVATPYQEIEASEVLKYCQRYYLKSFIQGTAPAQATGSILGSLIYRVTNGTAVTFNGGYIIFPVTMRSTPTATFYNPITATANWYNFTNSADSGAAAITPSNLNDRAAALRCAQQVSDIPGDTLCIHYLFVSEI